MLPMATGKRRTNSAVRVLVARVERVIAPVAELEHVRVVAEPELDRVEELAQVIVPAEAQAQTIVRVVARELGTVRLEGVPERDPAVAPLRTKSVTAAHRHDLVPLLTVEASAVAGVETSLAPAATEAAIAWVAVASAAVVAAAGEAGEAAVAAAEAEEEEEDVVDEQIR